MKRLISIIALIGFFTAFAQAGIPISDISAIGQRIAVTAKHIAKWKNYIDKFTKFSDIFDDIHNQFEVTISRFVGDELDNLLGDNITQTAKVVESIAYEDKEEKDVWAGMIKQVNSDEIFKRYKNLKETRYMTANPMYQNPYLKQIVDDRLKRIDRQNKDLGKMMRDLKLIRDTEIEILKKFDKYQADLKEYGEGEFPNLSKVATLVDLMDMEILRLNASLMSLARIMLEDELKHTTDDERDVRIVEKSLADEQANFKYFEKRRE